MHIGALIVDDQEDIRALIRMIIEAADNGLFVSAEAARGDEALGMIDEVQPEVVVLDQMMPGLSGLETAALILQRRPGQRMILCSAFLDDNLRRRAEEAGIVLCLPKEKMMQLPEALRAAVAAS